MSRRRAMKPSFEARIVNQVGRPWMLEGKRFLPETGMPIWKMARIRMLLEDMLPDPLAVATWIEKSLTTAGRCGGAASVLLFEDGAHMLLLLSLLDPARRNRGMIPKRITCRIRCTAR